MTDNRTTELLREGLTERGVEWRSGLEGVTFVGDWCFVEYDNGKLAATCEPVLTPDQAIAATLGNGTLTAEQVREAIERHSAWVIGNNRCFHDGAYEEIADELNAERYVETCHIVTTWCDSDYLNDVNYRCSKCGGLIVVDERNPDDYFEIISHANYCCNCGAKVVDNAD